MPGKGSASDGYDIEEKVTLESINRSKAVYSNISSTYCTQWGPLEAFREFVQNWFVHFQTCPL